MRKTKVLTRALALLAILVMVCPSWAKPKDNGPGILGTLDSNRASVDLSVSVVGFPQCTVPLPNTTQTYAVKAYIFQPSGRMFAIGLGFSADFNCSSDPNTSELVALTVNAFPGLTFKPGPATLVYQIIQTTTDNLTSAVTDVVVYEYGSRIDLH
jgi:hypothetical protein